MVACQSARKASEKTSERPKQNLQKTQGQEAENTEVASQNITDSEAKPQSQVAVETAPVNQDPFDQNLDELLVLVDRQEKKLNKTSSGRHKAKTTKSKPSAHKPSYTNSSWFKQYQQMKEADRQSEERAKEALNKISDIKKSFEKKFTKLELQKVDFSKATKQGTAKLKAILLKQEQLTRETLKRIERLIVNQRFEGSQISAFRSPFQNKLTAIKSERRALNLKPTPKAKLPPAINPKFVSLVKALGAGSDKPIIKLQNTFDKPVLDLINRATDFIELKAELSKAQLKQLENIFGKKYLQAFKDFLPFNHLRVIIGEASFRREMSPIRGRLDNDWRKNLKPVIFEIARFKDALADFNGGIAKLYDLQSYNLAKYKSLQDWNDFDSSLMSKHRVLVKALKTALTSLRKTCNESSINLATIRYLLRHPKTHKGRGVLSQQAHKAIIRARHRRDKFEQSPELNKVRNTSSGAVKNP